MNVDAFNKVYNPIERVLNKTGLNLSQISQIQLVGGSVRVPKVQEVLKSRLGSEYSSLLGQHMNGDDSMAFGAAFVAANFSANFRSGKKIELYHGPNYEIKIKLKHNETEENICPENQTELALNCTRKLEKNATVYKVRSGLDLGRTVSLKHDGDFSVEVFQKFEDSDEEALLATYQVTEIAKILKEMTNENISTPPKINLRFKTDAKGLITLKVDAQYEIVLYLTMQTGPTGGMEFVYTPNYTEPLSQEELDKVDEELKKISDAPNSNATASGSEMMIKMKKDVGKKRTQEIKKDLTVEVEWSSPRPLTKSELALSKQKLNTLDELDKQRIQTMEKRNSLETMIYAKKEWIDTEQAKIYGKEEELETARKHLQEISEWYEENSWSANIKNLTKMHKLLESNFSSFELRIQRHTKRDKAMKTYEEDLNKTLTDAMKLIKTKPWTELHYNTTFMKEMNVIMDWYKDLSGKQSELALHEVII
jgi:hypoxia up-regulated 1